METRELLVVDAFADEPLAGVPVPVLPDGSGMTDAQLRAVAAEIDAPGVVAHRDGQLRHVPRLGHGAPVAGAVAGCAGLADRAAIEAGTHTVTGPDSETSVELGEDRTVTATVEQEVAPAGVEPAEAAAALGLSPGAVADVDLPVGRADGAGGSLLVPVMFMEHLGELPPAPGALEELLGDNARLVAFSFDTLVAETDVHTRVFEPGAGGERAASAVGAAGCARFFRTQRAFDGELATVRVESGGFLDRPATLDASLTEGTVTGRALLGFAGTVNLPPDGDDDIITV